MFGILQKMDRYSNKLMSEEEKIDFMQEIIDNGMVWQMHEKYRNEAINLIGLGDVVAPLPLGFKRQEDKPKFMLNRLNVPAPIDAAGRDPFDTSWLCG